MNSLLESAKFFVLIFFELTALFLGISTLIGLIFRSISQEALGKALSKKGLLGNPGAALGAVTPSAPAPQFP